MPTTRDPLAAYTIAATILACVETRLEQVWADYPNLLPADQAVPPRSCVIAGGIAWDDCECGQLVVTIRETYPSTAFPQRIAESADATSQSRCGAPLKVFEFLVSMLRCAPTGHNEHPPTCAELDQAAQVATIDAHAVRTGVFCCLRDLAQTRDEANAKQIHDFTIAAHPMTGPAGACQGSELRVLVGINNPCPCQPPEGS